MTTSLKKALDNAGLQSSRDALERLYDDTISKHGRDFAAAMIYFREMLMSNRAALTAYLDDNRAEMLHRLQAAANNREYMRRIRQEKPKSRSYHGGSHTIKKLSRSAASQLAARALDFLIADKPLRACTVREVDDYRRHHQINDRWLELLTQNRHPDAIIGDFISDEDAARLRLEALRQL